MNDNELLLFEFLERAIRLYSHIEKSCLIASRPGARRTAQQMISVEVLTALKSIISSSLDVVYHDNSVDEIKQSALNTHLETLCKIHTDTLIAVPRPHEPIELISYLRQALYEPSANGAGIPTPHVFASEYLGDQAHSWFDPISTASLSQSQESARALAGNLSDFAQKMLNPAEEFSQTSPSNGFVSLPRIDLGNPCRWPSLLHEIGHFKCPDDMFKELENRISADRASRALELIKDYAIADDEASCKAELVSWLKECWCDAFAVKTGGPSIFFAQLHAFLFCFPRHLGNPTTKGSGYPPAWFRLKLILTLSQARIDGVDGVTKQTIWKAMENEKRLIYKLFDVPPSSTDCAELLEIFRSFVKEEYPLSQFTKSTSITKETLDCLVKDLNEGLPIPAVSSRHDRKQRAATIEEILLAGWMHRQGSYKSNFMEIVKIHAASQNDVGIELITKLKHHVDRLDESLKRSIQMVEWFNILHGQEDEAKSSSPELPQGDDRCASSPGLLSDKEILHLLDEEKLRVIPLIDIGRQICGTVIDLRLGHNFEIFFSNVHGAIDPLSKTPEEGQINSMEVDVDFLRSISIGPGQFLLGHTLEYIKLPKDVAAQIEGRSSFARLGIQVHMTANLVEVGFDGCLTLEIANSGPSTVTLYPGMRIAQIRLFRLSSSADISYGSVDHSSTGGNKYRGMLSHNKTQQFSDWEVSAFLNAKKRLGISTQG